MPKNFPKGHKGFKPKGCKNKKTLMWEQLGEFFTEAGAERAKTIMANCNDKEFMAHYTNLIELFKPKQSRVESNVSIEDNTLNINRRVINKDES
jgi:hypothetical protein